MRFTTKLLSVLMAGCMLTASVGAEARSVSRLSDSWSKYGITATGTWWIDLSTYYRQFQSKLTTTDCVSNISAGIYVYRMDNNQQVGQKTEKDTDYDECEAVCNIPYNVQQTPLKANASFYAKNDSQIYAIVNKARTDYYVTESN